MRPRSPEGHLFPDTNHRSARAALAVALTALSLGSAAAWANAQEAEPSSWPQYQGGPGHAGSLEEGPQPPFRERWMRPAPAGGSLSPAILVEDQAVTVGSDAVYGVDLASGTVLWEVPRAGGPLSTPAAGSVGGSTAVLYLEGPPRESEPSPSASGTTSTSPSGSPSGSPSPGEETVGPGGEEEPASSLVAVSLEDRTELWRLPLEGVARSGVTIDGATAYVGDQDGRVVAVALSDGSVVWSAEVPGRVDVPVAVSGNTVYVVARDADPPSVAIVALDTTTQLDEGTKRERWKVFPQATSTVGSAPAAGEGFVLVGSADRLLRSIAAEDGTERWASLVLSFFSPATAPAFAGDAVYAVDLSGGLYRFDAADGHRAWSHQLNEVVFRSAPVVSGPTVLLGLSDGSLVAIDAASGHLVWQSETTPGLVGTIALGPDVVVAVKGGKEAGLIAFEPDPQGTLVDLPSPTELDAGTTFSRYAVAAAVVLVGVLVPGMLLRRRLGPADLSGGIDRDDVGETEEEDEGETDEEEEP